jgi:hypothetical protein
MNTYIKILMPALIMQCFVLSGQQKSAQDSIIKINQVEVIKEFEVTLEEAQKVDIIPTVIRPEIQKHQYNYEVSIVPADLNYPAPEIRPLAMDPDASFLVNKGFVSAGYGNLKNPSISAGYHFSKKEKYNLILRADYDALDNSKKLAFQQYSELKTSINGDYLLKENMKIYGDIHFNQQNRYFYQTHLGVDTLYDKASSLRKINDFSIQAGIFNPERTETSLNYRVGMMLQSVRFTDQDIASSKAGLTFSLQKQRSKSTQWNIEGIAEVRSLNANPDQNIAHVQIKPYLTFNFSKARLTAGLNAFFDRNNTSPWPEAELLISLSSNQIQAFTGTTQRFHTNDPINQYGLNPFLNVRIDELVNNVYKDIYAGVKGELSFIAYQVSGGYKISKDHGFFISDSTDFRRFSQVRDDMKIVYVSGNIDFSVSENLTLGGVLTQNFYKTNTLDKPWHLPNFESNVYMLFNALNNKLRLRGELFIMDQVNFITTEGVAEKSNFRFDLNTTAEFYPIKNAGIYFKVINLLNNKFERWYGYPNVGIHMNAGISVIF